MSRHPALQTTGLSSVAEDPNNITPVERTAEREDRKLAMLRRMRPPPLKYAWNFYFDKHAEGSSYENRLTLMKGGIVTLKPFWSTINNFPLAALNMKDSVHFFKRGIKPVWEDSRNIKGGCWIFRVQKAKSEQFWQEVLMLAIGEQFAPVLQPRDDICGLTFSVRFKSNLISIWNRDGSNQQSIDNILSVVLDKLSPDLKPSTNTDKKEYYYKKHSEHAGFEEVVAGAKEAARQKLEAHEAKEAAAAAAAEAEAKVEADQAEDKNEDALVTEEEGNQALLKDHGGDADVNEAMMEQAAAGGNNGPKQSSGLREEVHADEP